MSRKKGNFIKNLATASTTATKFVTSSKFNAELMKVNYELKQADPKTIKLVYVDMDYGGLGDAASGVYNFEGVVNAVVDGKTDSFSFYFTVDGTKVFDLIVSR